MPSNERRATRWLAPAWITLPLAARRCSVRNPQNGAAAELSADQHAVLTACEGCRTLAEHANVVVHKLGVRDTDRATVGAWIEQFAALRLFVSEDELRRRFEVAAVSLPPRAPFAGIVIRTCDRPALLARVFASAAALERRFERRYRYHILDDSRSAANRAENARAVADSALETRYRDLSGRDPIVDEMASAMPAATDAIAWLVGPPGLGEATYGRPLNLALLLTAGQRVLFLDDDASIEPRRPPASMQSFSVSSAPDELFCYADRADLERACAPIDVDPFAEHLNWLGAPTGIVWTSFERDAESVDVALAAADAARFVPGARVASTQNHVLGDPGSSLFPYHLLSLSNVSRRHLLADGRRKDAAFGERIDWRGQLGPRLTPNRPLTFTTLAGLDNGVLLPPTVRAERNEDLLLGEMTRIVDRGAWSLDLPFALPHWRDPPKRWLDPATNFRQEPAHFLMDHLENVEPMIMSDDRADRLRSIGATLLDLAGASDAYIAELLARQAADTASRVQFAIANAIDDPGVAEEWKALLRPWLASPALSTHPAIVRERIAAPAAVRALARSYGAALALWPALWNWARERAPLV